ncbi:MAG: MFS transporter [Acidimicrobiia bacterium]
MRAKFATILDETFRSCRQRNFRLWFIGQSISQVGYFAQVVAMALLVLDLTASGTVLGLVVSLSFIPNLVVGPWAGVLSDRLDKRRFLIVTQTTMMLCAVWLGWLVLSGRVTLGWVLGLATLGGIAYAFDGPARRTIVTELVDQVDAANAVSLNGALNQAAKLVGPAVAGLLVDSIGIAWCFLANGMSSVAVVAALVAMDPQAMHRSPPIPRARGQIAEGFRYIREDRSACLILLMLVATTLLGMNWNVLLPLLATRDLGGSSSTLALLMAVMSGGSLLGVLWLARRSVVSPRALAQFCIAFGAASAWLSLAPSVLIAALAAFAVGTTSMLVFNGGVVALQLGAIDVMRGRVMAIFTMLVVGGYALGSSLSGWIAQVSNARVALLVGAITSSFAGIVVLVITRRNDVVAGAARIGESRTVGGSEQVRGDAGELDHGSRPLPSEVE